MSRLISDDGMWNEPEDFLEGVFGYEESGFLLDADHKKIGYMAASVLIIVAVFKFMFVNVQFSGFLFVAAFLTIIPFLMLRFIKGFDAGIRKYSVRWVVLVFSLMLCLIALMGLVV